MKIKSLLLVLFLATASMSFAQEVKYQLSKWGKSEFCGGGI